jgi:histidine ammonia-lyase
LPHVLTDDRHGTQAEIDENNLQKLQKSVRALQAEIDEGKVIYGEQSNSGTLKMVSG